MEGGSLSFIVERGGKKEPSIEHYFTIKRGFLLHAEKDEDISIRGGFFVLEAFDNVLSEDSNAFGLLLSSSEIKVHFLAPSEEERELWVAALSSAMGLDMDGEIVEEDSTGLSRGSKKKGLDNSSGSNNASTPPRLTGKAAQLMAGAAEESYAQGNRLASKFGMGLSSDDLAQRDNDEQSKVYYSLHLTVSEAKNLKAKSSTNFFAIVSLEHEVAHTRGVTANNADPLWAETHQLQVFKPEKFPLHVTVWDTNTLLGELQLPLLPLLDTPAEYGTWWKLQVGKADSFICGDLKVRVEKPLGAGYLTVTVMEGRNLARRSGFEQYLVKVSYARQELKTKAVKRVLNPVWNESLQFNLKGTMPIKLEVVPFGKFGKTGPSLGQATIAPSLLQGMYYQEWLVLQPEPSEKKASVGADKDKDAGEIRLDLAFSKHQVYPASHYAQLADFLLAQPLRIVSIFEKSTVVQGRERIANCLVKIFEAKNKAPTVLKAMVTHEAQAAQGIDTLFRANTIGSKAIDMFMKLVAKQWLYDIVFPTVKAVYKDKKSFEIDPNKIDKGEDARKNFKELSATLSDLLERVYAHKDELPNALREIFQHLTVEVEKRFPEEKDVRYIGVSGFLFLRFVGAAILGPKLFEIMEDHPDSKVLKSLTMLSRVIMKIAGMVQSEDRGDGFLGELEGFIKVEQDKMRAFIDYISLPKETSEFNPASVHMEQELANLCEYFEETLTDETLEKFYLDADIDIDTLDRLLLIMDEMAITENRRKPVLTSLRKARAEKNLPAADPEAYGKLEDDLKEKATSQFGKVKRARSSTFTKVENRSSLDSQDEENDERLSVSAPIKGEGAKNAKNSQHSRETSNDDLRISAPAHDSKKRHSEKPQKAAGTVQRATSASGDPLKRKGSRSKMIVTIPSVTSNYSPPPSPNSSSMRNSESGSDLVGSRKDSLSSSVGGGKKILDVVAIAQMYDGVKNSSMVVSSSGTILYVNSGLSKLLSLPNERIVGSSIGLYLAGPNKGILDPDELEKLLKANDQLDIKNAKGKVAEMKNMVHLDGSPVYLWTERS